MPSSVPVLLLAAAALATPADELSVARQALRDGLWDVARAHAEKAGDVDAARLVRLESLAAEGKWTSVSNALAGWADAKGAAFDYYRAVVRGDLDAAAALLASGGAPDGVVQARLHEADCRDRAGDRKGAESVWRAVCADTNASPRAFAAAAANLGDAALLRRAVASAADAKSRRALTVRLGTALLADSATAAEGAALVRAVTRDAPDVPGGREAFLAVADAALAASRWEEARSLYAEAAETWPDAARLASVQSGMGWALSRLGRPAEALEAFAGAERSAKDDETRATAALKQGDALTALGRIDEAMAQYRRAGSEYPGTKAAALVSRAVEVRELEAKGRELYGSYRFAEARQTFRRVAAADPSRAPRMRFFEALCLYGQGEDAAAAKAAEALLADCPDVRVRADACLWLARFRFSRSDWKGSARLFREASATPGLAPGRAADALLWAARAAFADGDFAEAIRLTTDLDGRFPGDAARLPGLVVQGEALIELSRFDEAMLVFDRVVAAPDADAADRARARLLRADVLFAMGADNPARYDAALEAYRSILFGGALTPSGRIVVSFKIARALEKLRRVDEAVDQYYTQVVLAYRRERAARVRMDDDARAAFAKAAFRLADEFEGRGKDRQASAVLDLVATSDCPAAEEARRRVRRIESKGGAR